MSKQTMFFFWLLMLTALVLFQKPAHFGEASASCDASSDSNFITTSGTLFIRNGRPLYFNGFNAYWLMIIASNPSTRGNITAVFQAATAHGITVARTWAFSDGGSTSLQISPGIYNEDMFKGLDFAVSEAGRYGIYLIISLVNSWSDFGGRKQYVDWAKERGEQLNSDDEFYTNPTVKRYYTNHVKTVLSRNNSLTGMAYKDDPTIFAWELMNEPRCGSNLSGQVLQGWIQEMANYVKSIDNNHLLEIGSEGFYGESKRESNPYGYLFGTDFISHNQIPEIDFTTVHGYPDIWFPDSDDQAQIAFIQKWLEEHTEDSNKVLKKPFLLTEFGKSSNVSSFNVSRRETYFRSVFNEVYESARSGGACGGSLFWQALNQGMDNFYDGYEVILAVNSSTTNVIAQQSRKLSDLARTRLLPRCGG